LTPRTTPRRAVWVALLLLLALPFAALSGCTTPPPVPDTIEKAWAEGEAKEKDARAAEEARNTTDAQQRWNNVASYYGAVASRYAGSDNGLKAVLEQVDALDKGAKNPDTAHIALKNALKSYTPINAPTQYEVARETLRSLEVEIDQRNRGDFRYKMMDGLVRLFGNNPRYSPTIAVVAVALLITLVLWPLRYKQYYSAKESQRWMPEIQRLQAKYKDDPQKLMLKQNEFYKTHGINQFAGCLPVLLQMPVTWFMYTVILNYQFRFSEAHLLWMNPTLGSASATWPFPFTHAIAHNLGESDLLLLVVYAASMYLQTKLMPAAAPTDPAQAETQRMMTVTMPIMFFIMMLQWQIASAFILYWFAQNVFGLIQQQIIYKTLPELPPFVVKGSDASGDKGDDAPPATAATNGTASTATGRPATATKRLISSKTRRRVQKK
jgi:YidC/Oxa1 family membrane protein insertase